MNTNQWLTCYANSKLRSLVCSRVLGFERRPPEIRHRHRHRRLIIFRFSLQSQLFRQLNLPGGKDVDAGEEEVNEGF
ncbi:hypothetical protein L6452_44530 [Arctium lappa]|uniref:Uncharacterized protein n=1 Tax=Arctium lappa TaxID=4217 RepID=A0ACB8XH56_ARCLA|nr:hypothetical protein L6452_44530 [Arctium lappa]